MAGGKNKEFMADPLRFFRTYYLGVPGNGQPKGGLSDIDIVDAKGAGVMLLRDYSWCAHGTGAQPVRANYLPVTMDDASVLALSPAAAYLFTADLSGCMFAAYGPDAQNVTVEHVNQRTAQAKVSIAARCNQIAAQRYGFCKLVCPGSISGIPGEAYLYGHNAAVLGLLDGGGWKFYLRPDPEKDTVVQL